MLFCIHVFWTDTKDDFFTIIAFSRRTFKAPSGTFKFKPLATMYPPSIPISRKFVNEVLAGLPMNPATNLFTGFLYVSLVEFRFVLHASNCTSTCRVLVADMITIRSAKSVIASVWSVVSYVDCNSNTTDFAISARMDTKFRKFDKVRPSNFLCITDNGTTPWPR